MIVKKAVIQTKMSEWVVRRSTQKKKEEMKNEPEVIKKKPLTQRTILDWRIQPGRENTKPSVVFIGVDETETNQSGPKDDQEDKTKLLEVGDAMRDTPPVQR